MRSRTPLLPWVEDDTRFFDSELLVLAERSGLRIHEVPVDGVDDPESRVDVMRTAMDDLRGMRQLGWALLTGRIPVDDLRWRVGSARDAGRLRAQLALFAFVGVVSSIAYTCLYAYPRDHLAGPTANVLALVLSTGVNTSLNRRFTLGIAGPGAVRAQAKGLGVLVGGVVTTTVALVLLRRASPSAALATEVMVLSLANLRVTAQRFAAMRQWVFRRRDTVGEVT